MEELGDLSKTPFPVLLAGLYRADATGTLIVRAGPYVKNVYIKDGAVIFAASSSRNDRLGEMLLRRKLLKLRDYEAVSEKIKPGLRFGTILVNMGLLSAGQLVKVVVEQVKEMVFSLFGLPSGEWRFTDGMSAADEVITLSINTTELLHQGVKRMDTVTPMLRVFHHTSLLPRLTSTPDDLASLFRFDEAERAVLEYVDGSRTIVDIADLTQLSNFELLKLLWVLVVLELMEVKEPARKADKESENEEPPDLAVTGEDLSELIP